MSLTSEIYWLQQESSSTLEPTEVLPIIKDSAYLADVNAMAPFFSRSDEWFYFRLTNSSNQPCERILRIGDPRIESVQVHQFAKGQWQTDRFGALHPFSEWTVIDRYGGFRVELDAKQSKDVLVQLRSRTLIPLRFELYAPNSYESDVAHQELQEGVMIGLVLSAIAVGFAVAILLRSGLLAVVSAMLLFYFPITLFVNGYLVYWPELMSHAMTLLILLNLGGVVLWGVFLFMLFRVRELPSIMIIAFLGSFAYGVAIMVASLVHDFGNYSPAYLRYRELSYLLYIAIFLFVWLQGIKLSWLARLLGVALLVQGAALHLLSIRSSDFYYADSSVSVFSNALLIVILLATMILAISRNKQKARQAENALIRQRENETTRLENMVALRTEQLKKLLESRTYMLASMSHDLRSPIASIVQRARSLMRKQPSEAITHIEQQAVHHLEMLEELLSMARDNFQELALNIEVGYTHAFLEEVANSAEQMMTQNNNRLTLALGDDLPPLLKADFKLVRRVLINLLENAAKFTTNGQVQLDVRLLESTSEQATIQFMVQDSGQGVDAEQKERLMAPYQRGKHHDNTSGFGLGLSIVTDLLGKMDSRLELCESTAGGACFYFVLQLEVAHEVETESHFIERYEQSVSGAGLQVLLVDDEHAVTESMEELLLGYEFDILTALSVEAAEALLSAEKVDLVITDQWLKGRNGHDLLKSIKTHLPDLPVILYSSSPERRPTDVASQPDDPAFDAVLLKPADTDVLLQCVVELCRKSTIDGATQG